MEIARGLRTHFDENAMERMPSDLPEHLLLVAEDEGRVVGFMTLLSEDETTAEITWMGVRRDLQRRGIGTTLLSRAESELLARGIVRLTVKTLADTVEYAPYEETRRFYRAMGFDLLEVIDPYPGWSPGNPCAIYVKALG